MSVCVGMDLHGSNVYCAAMDEQYRTVWQTRLPNDLPTILAALEPWRQQIVSVAVESTYNWYWLVDGLLAADYPARLAHPARMQENLGLKEANDRTDARFLARQQVMGVLPTGYIYPKEQRSVRDLLRRRMQLVGIRTGEWLSLQSLVARHSGRQLGTKALCNLEPGELSSLLGEQELVIESAQGRFRHIAFLDGEIGEVEKRVEGRVRLLPRYELLLGVPGIGRILALTIMLETGPIERFCGAGHYASYSRHVQAQHTSNGVKKRAGNGKNGNRYLAWAYTEAAVGAVRFSLPMQAWYERKAARTHRVLALSALGNKLSKACFYMLRDGKEFDVKRLVG